MNCRELDERLLDFVEGNLDEAGSGDVRAHLEHCEKCRQHEQETRDLLGAMAELRVRSSSAAGGTSLDAGTLRRPPTAAWGPGTRLGDFEIVEELGRGGMGVVYRARQVSLNRIVALKVLPPILGSSDKAVARFRREAQAAARLHHTNIVAIHSQGELDGHFFYAMDLVEGPSLDRAMRDPTSLFAGPQALGQSAAEQPPTLTPATRTRHGRDYRRLAQLVSEVADALDHAHRQGVIHRDIKPQNLLVGRDGRLRVSDFGLARMLEEPGVTLSGEMLGTPAYMSPEQVRADRRKIDARTDVYSLGVTFYELLVGRRPFEGATREQIIAALCTREPVAPRKIDPQVPIDLETICLRAIDKDPRKRYAAADEMAADLRRYAEDRPIRARRVGAIEKTLKWVRRHRAATAIGTLSILIVFGVAFWSVQRARDRRDRANRLVREAFERLAYEDYHAADEARAKLRAAEPLGPNEFEFRVATALSHLLDDRKGVITELEALVAQHPKETDALYLLAWAFSRDDQLPRELECISRADQLGGPRTSAGHFFRGQAINRQDYERAIDDYKKAIEAAKLERRPQYVQAMIHLARAYNQWMYYHRKLDYFSEQTGYLKPACLLSSSAYPRYLASLAYRISGEIYNEQGDEEEARTRFAEALRYAREAQELTPAWYGHVAEAEHWTALGRFEDAITALDRAEGPARQSGADENVFEARWRLHYWLGQREAAASDLRALATVCPSSDVRRAWFTTYFPALLRAESGEIDAAAETTRNAAGTGWLTVTASAAVLRILGHSAEADAMLSAVADQLNTEGVPLAGVPQTWLRRAFDVSRGALTTEGLAGLEPQSRNNQRCWAPIWFDQAALALGHGDRATALTLFRRCAQAYDDEQYNYLAQVFVKRMEREPTWPPWLPVKP